MTPPWRRAWNSARLSFAACAVAVALACVIAFAFAGHASAMTFRIAPDRIHHGFTIAGEGEITDATPRDFLALLQARGRGSKGRVVLLIDSRGGKVWAGMELGRILRRIGATAVVARVERGGGGGRGAIGRGSCYSACVYALMGAARRVAPSASQIGVHRIFAYRGGTQRFDDGEMGATLSRYARAMGVNPELVAAAEHVAPGDMRILTRREIEGWRLASASF